MAKHATAAAAKPNMYVRLRTFLHEVKSEMDKVAWPTRDELHSSTQVVLVLLVIMAAIAGIYDFVFRILVLLILKVGA